MTTPGLLRIGGVRIDVGVGDDVVLLGDEGQVLMTMTRTSTPTTDSEPVAARPATPNDLIGDWRLTYLAAEPKRTFGDISVLRIRAGDGGDSLDWTVASGCPIRQGTLRITTSGDQQQVAPGRSETAPAATAVCDPKAEVLLAAHFMAGATSYGMTADGRLVLEGSGAPVLAVFERT